MGDGQLCCICDGHLLQLMTSYPAFKKAREVAWFTRKKRASDRKHLYMFTQHPRVKNRPKRVDREIKVAWQSSFGVKQ